MQEYGNDELTPAEQKRLAAFHQKKEELQRAGYTEFPLFYDIGDVAKEVVTITLPLNALLLAFYLAMVWMRGTPISGMTPLWLIPLYLLLFFPMIVLHELIHGLFWGFFAKGGYSTVEFGIIRKYWSPYCTCSEPLKRHQYVIGALMPTVVLGIVPCVVAAFWNHIPLFVLGQLMLSSGGGDVFIVKKLLAYQPKGDATIFMDHPTEMGLVALEKGITASTPD